MIMFLFVVAIGSTIYNLVKRTAMSTFANNAIWSVTSFAFMLFDWQTGQQAFAVIWAVLFAMNTYLTHKSFKRAFPEKPNENSSNGQAL